MQLNVGGSSIGGAGQTSSDLLKNTPSNIRKLSDEIGRCEGRHKYLAHTRSPSDGGDVRWYFCKVPLAVNELAASVPHTDIVGKGEYFRFGMRDSLAIEASFLQREDELLSRWWKEYAECSVGPSSRDQSSVNSESMPHTKETFTDSLESIQSDTTEEERVGVPVKGGLYEVDLMARHCFPVYWSGENRRVLRGHWFARKGGLDWLPVREDVSEQLEYTYRCQVWHRRTFQQSGLFAARVDLQGSTPGMHVLFTGEDDTWEAWLNVDASSLTSFIGFGRNGIKLRRGYTLSESQKPTQDELRQQEEEKMDDYCSQVPVRHLVFMVHGIGQRLEKSNLVDDVGSFRHLTASLAERHLTSNQRGTQRVLFIPCQWRKGLTLSGEIAVEKITLDGVRRLRTMLGATVHDVLYYMSPIYCQDIIDSISNQLNILYLKFLKRNPSYDGKVSLYGHSLGSVLSYDILCHQETLCSSFHIEEMSNNPNLNEASCSTRKTINSGPFTSNSGHVSTKNVAFDGVICHEASADLMEDHREGSCNRLGPPSLSESEGSTTTDTDCRLTNDLSSKDENVDEPSGDFRMDSINKSNSMNDEFLLCNDNKDDKDIGDSEKDELFKSLRDEIISLKAKLKEIEGKQLDVKRTQFAIQSHDPECVPSGEQDTLKSYTPLIRYTKLEFKVDTFFAVGSPLGVFLSLRNVRIGIGEGKQYWEDDINEEMPACRQMFNIFHPFDPVAYRIEPLICKESMHKRPVIIPYHRGGKRLYIGFQEFEEWIASRSHDFMYQLNTVKVKVLTICESRESDDPDEASGKAQEIKERSYGSIMMERLTGSEEGRVDHVLQDKTFRHQYLSALVSHTNYWRDPDTCLFILRHLYRDIPEEPLSPTPSDHIEGSSERRSQLKGWSDPREVDDEELPLTFADSVSVKHIFHRAKKLMKS